MIWYLELNFTQTRPRLQAAYTLRATMVHSCASWGGCHCTALENATHVYKHICVNTDHDKLLGSISNCPEEVEVFLTCIKVQFKIVLGLSRCLYHNFHNLI